MLRDRLAAGATALYVRSLSTSMNLAMLALRQDDRPAVLARELGHSRPSVVAAYIGAAR